MDEAALNFGLDSKARVKTAEKGPRKDNYGLNIQQLQKWQQDRQTKADSKEKSMQAKAVAKVVGFLNAINVAVQLQSWFRMCRVRKQYYAVLAARRDVKYVFFRAWKIDHYSEKMHRYSTVGQYFVAWKDELIASKRLKKLIFEFFKICIKRSRLTPQACMCYFNPGEWSKSVSTEDMMKIRRLMLEKLFSGWRTEARELRIMRSKATQVLSRMVRRTKGPLWVKESSLVCFHMWYRYVKVKRAYRHEEPDPRFTNPYLPQWTKLFKEITLARVKRKRSLMLGHRLTQSRAFRTWKYLKSIDRSKPVTALAVAIMHYGKVITRKCLVAWYDVVRERGKIVRFRNEIFYRWKKWAPNNRKLWAFNDKALAWLRLKQMRRAYNVMVDLCLTVISKRTERMKELRRNFYDRKVVICAYALMNRNEHVIFVDCWRRLYHYWQCRRKWKAYNIQRKCAWHMTKARVIFGAWKTYVQARVDLKRSNIPQMRELFQQPSQRFPSLLAGQAMSPSSTTTTGGGGGGMHSVGHRNGTAVLNDDSNDEASVESLGDNGSIDSAAAGATPQKLTAGGQLKAARAAVNAARRKRVAAPVIDYQALIDPYTNVGYQLMEDALAGKISKGLTESQFQLFCLAIIESRAQAKRAAEGEKRAADKPRAADFTPGATAVNTPAPGTPATAGGEAAPSDPTADLVKQLSVGPQTKAAPVSTEEAESNTAQAYSVSLQSRLQQAIDEMCMEDILSAVSEGAVIEPQHIRQVGVHVGDHYIPAFTVLLSGGVGFLAERMVKKDTVGTLNACQNPVNAFLLGSHLERWARRDLTKRELAALTDAPVSHAYDAFAGPSASIHLWRGVVLKLLDAKTQDIARTCTLLTEGRTVIQEVGETLKRNKIERLNSIRKNMVSMFGMSDEGHAITAVPPLVVDQEALAASQLFSAKKAPTQPAAGAAEGGDGHDDVGADVEVRDIYVVLREFTLMTGKLTNEGKAMRGPLLERDALLLANGFVKQSKLDFQALRRQCMTPAQLAADDERLAKEAEKRRKELEKSEKGKKGKKGKKRRGSSAKRKKSAKKKKSKGKKGGAGSDTDTDYDSDGYSTATSMSADELAGSINVRYNDYYMDGEFMFSDELAPAEESDVRREREYQRRVAPYRSAVYQEVWVPQRQHLSREGTLDSLGERHVREMKATVQRLLAALQKDELIGAFDFPDIKARFGGLGQYLLDKVSADPKVRASRTWHVLPKEWWSFKQVKARLTKELAVVEGSMAQHKAKIAKQNDLTDGLDDEINFYEKYLKSVRKEVLKISQKRSAKTASDGAEKAGRVGALRRAEKALAATNKQISVLAEKLRLAEIYLAVGNVKGVLSQLKPPEPEDEPQLDAKGKPIPKDPAKVEEEARKKKEKEKKKKAKKGGKKGSSQEEEGDSDGSEDSYSLYGLIEQAKVDLAKLKEQAEAVEAKRLKADLDIRDYDRQCYRTTKLLKNLAEDRFNTMVEVQAIVIRTAKTLDASDKSKTAASKARKQTMKYFMQLRAFCDVNMQARGLQLAKDVEHKRLTELLRKPTMMTPKKGDDSSVTSNRSGDHTPVHSAHGGSRASMRRSFSGAEVDHHHKPDHPLRHSMDVSNMAASNADQHLEQLVLPDITLTDEELGMYDNAHRGGSPTDSMYSFDEGGSGTDEGTDRSRDRSPDRDAHLDPSEYRPLTVDEEIMLLHQNSIGNRKKREEELKRIAALQAEEAAANELRTKVFDEYWSSYPKREIYVTVAQQAAEEARKRQKEQEEAEKAAAEAAKQVTKPLNKTSRMWKSVGEAYWRKKEEAVRSQYEILMAAAMGDNDDFADEDMEAIIEKQKELQREANKHKADPFEECIVVDVRKEWDKAPADQLSGLPHRIAADFAHLGEEVFRSTTVPPPPAGALAALAAYVERPPLSTSVRDLLKAKKAKQENAVMSSLLDMTDTLHDYAAESRRPSNAGSRRPSDAAAPMLGAGSRTPSFAGDAPPLVAPSGPGKKKARTVMDVDDEDELDNKVVDPFATIGRLEYMRFKVGMQAKSELTHKDDDMSFSVESRTGGGSLGSNTSSRRAERKTAASPSKDFNDDISEVSGGEQSVGSQSHASSHAHQKQVNEYLSMIDEPRDTVGKHRKPRKGHDKGEKRGETHHEHRHISQREEAMILKEVALADGMDIVIDEPPPSQVEVVPSVVSPIGSPTLMVDSQSPARSESQSPFPKLRPASVASDGPAGSQSSDKVAKPVPVKAVSFGEDTLPAPALLLLSDSLDEAVLPVIPMEAPVPAVVSTPMSAVTPPDASFVPLLAPTAVASSLDDLILPQSRAAKSQLQDDETSEISMDENLRAMGAPQNIDLHSHEGSVASPAGGPPKSPVRAVQFHDQLEQEQELVPIQVSVTKSPAVGSRKAPVEGQAAPEHLGKVLAAASNARSSIKVKRGGPESSVHDKFLPGRYQEDEVSTSELDLQIPPEGQQRIPSAYLEMPAVSSPGQSARVGSARAGSATRKRRLIHADKLSPTRRSMSIDPAEAEDLIAVSVRGSWELQSPPLIALQPSVNKELHYSFSNVDLAVAGQPLVNRFNDSCFSLDGLDGGRPDHDPVVDKSHRLLTMLGLSPSDRDKAAVLDDEDEFEEVHNVTSANSIPAELNYESLVGLVDEFRTELKLLEDREASQAEDFKQSGISFFPAHFRKEVMKNAPRLPKKLKASDTSGSGPDQIAAVAAANASAAAAAAAQAAAAVPAPTPTKRNRNLTKVTSPAAPVAPAAPAPVASPPLERRESKAVIRPMTPPDVAPPVKKATTEELEAALHRYLVDTYHLNPAEVTGERVERAEVQEAVRGIKQYMAEQERLRRQTHSAGRIRPLESRHMAHKYRSALRAADTLIGQGGLFFKPPSPSSPQDRARQQLTQASELSQHSSVNLKRAGSADFWVEVIKLLHPDNEFNDEASVFSEVPAVVREQPHHQPPVSSSGRKHLPSLDGAPDMSMGVIKLNHPQNEANMHTLTSHGSVEGFRTSKGGPPVAADPPPFVRVDPSDRGMAYSQSDSLLLQSKGRKRIRNLPFNDRFAPEVLDLMLSGPVLQGRRVEKSASAAYLPHSEEYYRTGSPAGLAEKQAAALTESIRSYMSTHPENINYKLDGGSDLTGLRESFGFAPEHELVGTSVPSSPGTSRPVSPQAQSRKGLRSGSPSKPATPTMQQSGSLRLNHPLFAESSLDSAQIISEIAGEHYHISGNNSLANTERASVSRGVEGFNPLLNHSASFTLPLLDANMLLNPPSPDNISIYSKHTLRSAEERIHRGTGETSPDNQLITGENSLLMDSQVLRSRSPPRTPSTRFSSPPRSASGLTRSPSRELERELSGVISVTALNRQDSTRPVKKKSFAVASPDGDDDSSIQSSQSQLKDSKYLLGSLDSRSLTLDDYMRMKQAEGKYLHRPEDEAGGGGVVGQFKRKMRTPSPVKKEKSHSFLEAQAAAEADPLELSCVEAMRRAFQEEAEREERERLAAEEAAAAAAAVGQLSRAPSMKIVRASSQSSLEDNIPKQAVNVAADVEHVTLKVVGISKSPVKKADSGLLILDDESVPGDQQPPMQQQQPSQAVAMRMASMEEDDEEEMERELRAMLSVGQSQAQENARLYAAMYNHTVKPLPSANNVPFLAGNGSGDSKHFSTHPRDKGGERRGRPRKTALLPPLQATPPTSAGSAEGTTGTVYRGLTDVLNQSKLLKPLPKKTLNPLYQELVNHLPSKQQQQLHRPLAHSQGLPSPQNSVHSMSATAPNLAMSGSGRLNRAGSVTSLGSEASSKYSREVLPMGLSVDVKQKKRAI